MFHTKRRRQWRRLLRWRKRLRFCVIENVRFRWRRRRRIQTGVVFHVAGLTLLEPKQWLEKTPPSPISSSTGVACCSSSWWTSPIWSRWWSWRAGILTRFDLERRRSRRSKGRDRRRRRQRRWKFCHSESRKFPGRFKESGTIVIGLGSGLGYTGSDLPVKRHCSGSLERTFTIWFNHWHDTHTQRTFLSDLFEEYFNNPYLLILQSSDSFMWNYKDSMDLFTVLLMFSILDWICIKTFFLHGYDREST